MTTIGIAALHGGWAVLKAPAHDEYASYPLDAPGSVDIRLAVDRTSSRHLLVEFPGQQSPASGPDSPLVERVWTLTFGGRSRTYLDVACMNSGLWDVFDELIVDVLQIALPAPEPGIAVKDALESWRALFKTGLIRGLSRERRLGLFAELVVLQEAVGLSSPAELNSWVGPSGAPHDFEFVDSCVEVKAVGIGSAVTRIHGLGQLEPHDSKPLHLLVLTVVESDDGQRISSLIDRLVHAGVDVAALRSGLNQSGWSNDSAFDEPFAVSNVLHVPVGEATPRITSQMLIGGVPDGVSGIGYDIAMDVLAEHASGESLRRIIAKAVGS